MDDLFQDLDEDRLLDAGWVRQPQKGGEAQWRDPATGHVWSLAEALRKLDAGARGGS